jgi:FkbM family methyltransferase
MRLAGDKGKRGILEFRNGLSLEFRYHTSDLATSRSVFVDDSYFPPGISIPPDATVLDIGAHIGTFTLNAALRAPRGRIFSFEPEPGNYALLTENVRRNSLSHVRCFNLAVAGKEESRQMFQTPNPVRTGAHSLVAVGSGQTFGVQCTTLSSILREHRLLDVSFLKLDCEGAEWEIFPATPDEDLARIRALVMEIHRHGDADGKIEEQSFERLKSLGFVRIPHRKSNYAAFARP